MLSRDLFRTDPDRIRTMLALRRADTPFERLLEVDREWRSVVVRLDEARAARKAGSKEVGKLFQEGRRDEGEAKRAEMAALGDEIAVLEERSRALEAELEGLELSIPNLIHETVPEGGGEADNRVERTWGEPTAFDFEPQAHWDLGAALGILDFERAAKIAGARFAVLAGAGAALERALISYMLDLQTRRNGYREVLPPYLVNSASLTGTGQLPKFGADLFHVEGTDYYLAPTAEVPVVFDPDTAAELLGTVFSAMSGYAVFRNATFLKDRLGEAVASPLLTVVDEGRRPRRRSTSASSTPRPSSCRPTSGSSARGAPRRWRSRRPAS
jgi:seryl-tRNA synthetase